MKAVIAGAGESGLHLAHELLAKAAGHFFVEVIDTDAKLLKELQQNLNVRTHLGNCTDLTTLHESGVDDADFFIASTRNDETNLVACMLAKMAGCGSTVAMVRSEKYGQNKWIAEYRKSGVDHLLNTTRQIAEEVFEVSLLNRNATEIVTFAERQVTLLSTKIPQDSELGGKRLMQADFGGECLVGCLVRGDQAFIPQGNDLILPGDAAYFILPTRNFAKVTNRLGLGLLDYRKGVVVGNDDVSKEIALKLSNTGLQTTLVGNTNELGKRRSESLENAGVAIIGGNPVEVSTQLKADVSNSNVFIAMMDDYVNITSCMVAKYLGAEKTIAMINSFDMNKVADLAGIDVKLSRRLFGVRFVKKILAGENVGDFTTVGDTPIEILRLDVSANSPLIDNPLMELPFPENSLVALIIDRRKNFVIPTGTTRIQAGDQAVLFSVAENLAKLKSLFLG